MRWFAGYSASLTCPVITRPAGGRPVVDRGRTGLVLCGQWLTRPAVCHGDGWDVVAIDGPAPLSQRVGLALGELRAGYGPQALAELTVSGVLTLFADDSDDSVVIVPEWTGRSPVFYAESNGAVVFGSSARALASVAGQDLNYEWLSSWLVAPEFTTPFLTGSPWRNVQRVRPGTALVLKHGIAKILEVVIPSEAGNGAPESVRAALADAISRRVASASHVTSDLSGGMDSTGVTMLASSACVPDQRLTALTLNTGLATCDDLKYARLVAERNRTMRHIEITLPGLVDPYLDLADWPETDEPYLDLVNFARTAWWLRMVADLGSAVHLTGDAGDAVALAPMTYLGDMVRIGRVRQAWQHTVGWARLRHQPLHRMVKQVVKTAAGNRSASVKRFYAQQVRPARVIRAWSRHISHVDPSGLWAWVTSEAIEHATMHAARDHETPSRPLATDQMAIAGIQAYGHAYRAEAAIAESLGVNMQAPYLDPAVAQAFLCAPVWQRTSPFTLKPLLASALARVVPPDVLTRSTKGDFSPLVYRGIRANVRRLRSLIRHSELGKLGLLDVHAVDSVLRSAGDGLGVPLGALAKVISTEVWLQRSRPRVEWESVAPSQPAKMKAVNV